MDRHAGTRLALELRDSDVPLVRGGARGPVDALPGVHEPVRVLDRALELRVQPTEEFMETTMRGRTWFLFGGLGMSALIAGGVFQALRHRWVEAEQDRQHVQALESLNEITAAISARLGSSQQLLDQLAASASTLAGMESAAVFLLDDDRKTVRIASSSSGFPADLSAMTFSPADAPLTWQAIRDGRIVTLEDAHSDNRPGLNTALMARTRVRSCMAIPLRIGQRTIGALMLSDSRASRFTDREL